MTYEEIKKVQDFIKSKVEECSKKNDYASTWEKVKHENYGLKYYSESYIRQTYSKICGHTIYHYYSECVYNSLVNSLMDESTVDHISNKQKIHGVKKAKTKIEAFFEVPLEEIIKNKNVQIENIKEYIEKASYIKSYDFNEDGSVTLEIDNENFIYTFSKIFKPIVVPEIIKKTIDSFENINAKVVLIMSYMKAISEQTLEISISMEEFKNALPYLSRLNLYNPIKRDNEYWYIHDYSDQEKTALRIAFERSDLNTILSHAQISEPNNMKLDIIEDFYNIVNEGNTRKRESFVFSDDEKEQVINLLIELLCQGYLYFK